MTETLPELQRLFASLLPYLLTEAQRLGFQVRCGETWRPPETAALYAQQGRGIQHSLHCDRLAIDLLLDKDGIWQPDTEAYRALGDYWETLHPRCAWGGRFGDGGHFSISYGGRR